MSNIEKLFAACQELLDVIAFRETDLQLPREYDSMPAIREISRHLPDCVRDLRQAQERTVARECGRELEWRKIAAIMGNPHLPQRDADNPAPVKDKGAREAGW